MLGFQKKVLLIICITAVLKGSAQDLRMERLDSFFAGVPLQQSYNKWVDYISTHPSLGIDSVKERGTYSSVKPGMKSFFILPEHKQIKLIYGNEIIKLYNQKLKFDTVKAIMIEWVFGNSASGREESYNWYKKIVALLLPNYKKFEDSRNTIDFLLGKSDLFPECTLQYGYFEELKFPFVVLAFASGKRIKDINLLKISKSLKKIN